MAPIPSSEIPAYEECFRWFDKDNDGYILGEDLPVALRAMGQFWTYQELRDLTEEVKRGERVDLGAFLRIGARKHGMIPDASLLEDAFNIFDVKRTGVVPLRDLEHLMCTVGEKLSPSDFSQLCKMNGIKESATHINKDQFMRLFCGDLFAPVIVDRKTAPRISH